jgi:CheY-like chemotaxis protein
MAVTIILADDHHMMRQGLRMLLEAEEDFRVVAEAGDGREAARLAEHFTPDILIVDVMMPGLNGLEATRQVGQRSPRTPDAQTGSALPGRPNPLRPTSWYLAAGAVSGWGLPIGPLLLPFEPISLFPSPCDQDLFQKYRALRG